MASGHHLNSSVSILLALAKDSSSSLVQVCYVSQTFSVSFWISIFLGVTETYSINYRPFHGFFNFWLGLASENPSTHGWKSVALTISQVGKFKCNLLKTSEDIATQTRRILQRFLWWGKAGGMFVPPTRQTSGKFRDFMDQYLRSLWMYLRKATDRVHFKQIVVKVLRLSGT